MARLTEGHVVGLDAFPKFIDIFNAQAAAQGLQNRVEGRVGTMEDLPFAEEELDLIWSEGAIYNIGFERGLSEWRKYLKPGGYIAVSEGAWFSEERPKEIHDFWMDAYPGIDTIPNQVSTLQRCGYQLIAAFALPTECWTEHFYAPQFEVQEAFLQKYAGNVSAAEFIRNQRHERELYRKYHEYYGYAFYIGRKI